MAGQFTPYSPLKNTLDLDGYTVQGFPEDEYITIEADADSMTATPGTDATVCLVENHNPLATMKLKLLQNSQANSVLADFERNKTLQKQGLRRMFLHAARLEMRHPLTGDALILKSELPEDLAGFLAGLGG